MLVSAPALICQSYMLLSLCLCSAQALPAAQSDCSKGLSRVSCTALLVRLVHIPASTAYPVTAFASAALCCSTLPTESQ